MQTGQLKHRLKIQAFEVTQDENTGAQIEGWVDVASIWAKVEGVQGREFLQSSAEQASTTWRMTIRYRDLNPAHRITDGTRLFNVKAVLPNNDKTFLTLMCESGIL